MREGDDMQQRATVSGSPYFEKNSITFLLFVYECKSCFLDLLWFKKMFMYFPSIYKYNKTACFASSLYIMCVKVLIRKVNKTVK